MVKYYRCELKISICQVPVQLPLLSVLSKLRISVPTDLRPKEEREKILLAVKELEKRFQQGLPKLNPVKVCSCY